MRKHDLSGLLQGRNVLSVCYYGVLEYVLLVGDILERAAAYLDAKNGRLDDCLERGVFGDDADRQFQLCLLPESQTDEAKTPRS